MSDNPQQPGQPAGGESGAWPPSPPAGYPPPPGYPPQGAYPPPPGYPPEGAYPPQPALQVGTIPPPPGMLAGFQYGGFWVRWAARSLDGFAIYGLTLLCIITIVGILALPFLWLGYFPYFWARGGTPGQRICGLRIVRASDGVPIDAGTAIVRFLVVLGELVLCIFLVGLLGFIWVAFDSRKRAWHDMAAGTVVVHAQLYELYRR